jgi:glycerophosphoryl diester phosphodiesterase
MSSILNIAHRGFHENHPDNTMEAFEAALKLGVDGIEFDIQETIDNKFVVFHDDKLNGVEISKISISEVEKIKIKNGYQIPSLPQVLNLCHGRVKLFIDLKKIKSISKLLAILRKEVVPEDIVLVSFHKELISGISFLAPEVDTSLITALPLPNPVRLARETMSKGIVPNCGFVDLKLVKQAREESLSIFVWGCANIKAAQKVAKLDIDGIITDFPDQVKKQGF